MCKTPKSEGNILKGPWKARPKREVKLPDIDVVELQENMMFCDNLTEGVSVQLIHSVGENGFEVNSENFIRDMAFIIECIRGMLYRELDIKHPMADVMAKVIQVKETLDTEDNVAGYEYKIDYEDKLNIFVEQMTDEEKPKDPA
jgi:hypothetical protein